MEKDKENIISIEDRIPKLKQSRKKKANRRLLFYLSIFFLLISLIVYLQSPLSNVKHIDVTGNDVLSEEEVLSGSGLAKGNNMWAINKSKITHNIEENPLISNVSVSREFPQSVNVDVEEFQIIGYMPKKDGYYPILENGKVLTSKEISNKGDGPLLHNFTDDKYLIRLSKELTNVPDDIFNLISEITWEPTEKNKYKIMLYMNDGYLVEATIRNFAAKMEAYPSIISQLDEDDKGIIHMGVGTYFEKFPK